MGSSDVAAEILGGVAGEFFELAGEIEGVFEADPAGDFVDAEGVVGQQPFGLVHLELMAVAQGRDPHGLLEDMGEVER